MSIQVINNPSQQRARQQQRPADRGRNVSLLVALSRNGIDAHETIVGAWNASKLLVFFEQSIFPHFNGEPKTFVMDNVRFHHNRAFLDTVEAHGHQVNFLPLYSPWLNIAENVFGKVKPVVTRQELLNHNGLVNVNESMLNTITTNHCTGWNAETTRWLAVAEAGHALGCNHDATTAIQHLGVQHRNSISCSSPVPVQLLACTIWQ